jgi:lipopolysaccharide/colanic/teichoic acid biosynthesis glycosyltransferase
METASRSQSLGHHLETAIAFCAAIAVLVLSNLGRIPNTIADFLIARITWAHMALGLVFLAAWQPCFSAFDKSMKNREPVFMVLGYILRGATLATLVLAAILYVAAVKTPPLLALPLFWSASVILVTSRVILARLMLSVPWRHRNQVLIVGTGPIGRRAWRHIRTMHHRSSSVVGFADINAPQSTTYPEITSKYLGDIKDMEKIVLNNIVDTVVIALPAKSCYQVIEDLLPICESVGIDDGNTLPFNLPTRENGLTARILKRALDLAVAIPASIVLFPIGLLIAATVRLDSPGTALFKQRRYGYRRREFTLLKFRTMVADAEQLMNSLEDRNERDGPIFKIKNDHRITRVGRFLRRTSLDELPQLINVLSGSMSLVGPRPMSIRDVPLLSSSFSMRRFRVKPGITGLWQVSGRSNLTFDQWIAMDFRYIDNWSIKLDLSILLRTIPAVLKGTGAM